MYLFARRGRLEGSQLRDGLAWAMGIREKAAQVSGTEVNLWMQMFSPQVGTLGWTTWAPDLATLEALNDKLMADDGYLTEVERGAQFVPAGVDDDLSILVHGAPDPNRQIEYVTVVESVCAPGAMRRAMDLGVRIATKATELSGHQTLFLAGQSGTYGRVLWLTGVPSIADLDEGNARMMADESWLEVLDEVGGVFTDDPFATNQSLFRRLA